MGLRLRHHEWQRQLWRLFSHPVTEVVALVALVLLALAAIVTTESRALRDPQAPVVFGPR